MQLFRQDVIGRSFDLESEDLGEQWKPVRVKVVGAKRAQPTGQKLFQVVPNVPLPEDIFGPNDKNRGIYLGNTPGSGPSPISPTVDIYVCDTVDGGVEVSVRYLRKLGMGTIKEGA